MRALYRFYWDCGRQGRVEGLFVAAVDEVAAAIGKEVYFGEILGKHSEVYGTLEAKDLTVVSEDQERIAWLVELLGAQLSGYNPLGALRCECGAVLCDEECYCEEVAE